MNRCCGRAYKARDELKKKRIHADRTVRAVETVPPAVGPHGLLVALTFASRVCRTAAVRFVRGDDDGDAAVFIKYRRRPWPGGTRTRRKINQQQAVSNGRRPFCLHVRPGRNTK